MAEPEEIIAKRPSHPVTSTLLIVTALALGLNVYFAVDQLGAYYNRDTLAGIKANQNSTQRPDYYAKDFNGGPTDESAVRKDLKIDDSASGGGGSSDSGSGDEGGGGD